MLGKFERVLEALAGSNVDFVIVGGVAVVMHGHLRMTNDLDLAVDLTERNLERCLGCLADLGYQPQAPVDMMAFADADQRQRWVKEKNMTVFSPWSSDRSGPTVDLFADPPFDYQQLKRRAVTVSLAGHDVSVVSLDDLVAMKQAVGRPQDLADVLSLKQIDDRDP